MNLDNCPLNFCCGIIELGGFFEPVYEQERTIEFFKEDIEDLTHFLKSRYNSNKNFLITLNQHQQPFLHKTLLSLGFRCLESNMRNGPKGNRLYLYLRVGSKFNLPKRK